MSNNARYYTYKYQKQSKVLTIVSLNFIYQHLKKLKVLESLLKFDLKLTDYFTVEDLLENSSYLLKLFSLDIATSADIDLNDNSKEMLDYLDKHNNNFMPCRMQAIDLIFNNLYKKHCVETSCSNQKDIFFNCFLIVITRIFELKSIELLNYLKKSKFFADIQHETHSNETENTTSPRNTPVKKFYSSSSISLTNISTGTVQTSRLITDAKSSDQLENDIAMLNELFDQYLQICVKFMLSNKQTDKLIKHPQCFENLNNNCQLLDIIIFEVSVRLCAQSLFLTNASFYLDICTKVLSSLFEKKTYKSKKNKTQVLEELFLKSENNGKLIYFNVNKDTPQIL